MARCKSIGYRLKDSAMALRATSGHENCAEGVSQPAEPPKLSNRSDGLIARERILKRHHHDHGRIVLQLATM
jgi:hypothetical protein